MHQFQSTNAYTCYKVLVDFDIYWWEPNMMEMKYLSQLSLSWNWLWLPLVLLDFTAYYIKKNK